MSSGTVWTVVLAGSLACYLLKLAGLSVPAARVQHPLVTRVVEFVPAALLAALALALRAPFIVVLVLAGAAGALVHVLTG